MVKLSDFLRISEAAEYLGVSANTLRNWENAGKIAAHRHPVNGYRLFKKEDLDALLEMLDEPRASAHSGVNSRSGTRQTVCPSAT